MRTRQEKRLMQEKRPPAVGEEELGQSMMRTSTSFFFFLSSFESVAGVAEEEEATGFLTTGVAYRSIGFRIVESAHFEQNKPTMGSPAYESTLSQSCRALYGS